MSVKKSKIECESLKILQKSDRSHLLSDLLPYHIKTKQHSRLIDGLKEYRLLLLAAEQALTHFLNGAFSDFDALVGENACHIRATMILLIANQPCLEIKNLLKRICCVLDKVNFAFKKGDFELHQSLYLFVLKNKIDIKISFCEKFLVSSFILTKVRELLPPNPSKWIVRNERTSTKKVKEISDVGSSFARDLVKRLRNLVSTASVSFIQEIAHIFPSNDPRHYMVSNLYCVSHDKFGRLKCLPSFWYTLALMRYAVLMDLPLVMVVSQIASDCGHKTLKKESFYFKVVKGSYRLVSPNQFEQRAPAVVVLGSCCRRSAEFPEFSDWKEEIQRYDPCDLILAYAAAHRQYPDESKDVLIEKSAPPLYHTYKSKALEWGCSLDNPSLFFLVHVYCDQIKNIENS
ncbi:MAG: hypothetical protein S4CHLAM2_07470 [Chlamydiales bacterium]|nr:hypothetical protein [Chlamydiales bacterium]